MTLDGQISTPPTCLGLADVDRLGSGVLGLTYVPR